MALQPYYRWRHSGWFWLLTDQKFQLACLKRVSKVRQGYVTTRVATKNWRVLGRLLLRVSQVAAFNAAAPERQALPIWGRMFLLGAIGSGLTLASAALVLVPVENFEQQAWVFGLIERGDAFGQRRLCRQYSCVPVVHLALFVAARSLSALGRRCAVAQLGLARTDSDARLAGGRLAGRSAHSARAGTALQNQALIESLQQAQIRAIGSISSLRVRSSSVVVPSAI